MTVNRKKKARKYRGSKTHGGGSMKKRRGAGHRGGRGNAGSGKRADQKKPSILKEFGSSYFGKKGFKRPFSTESRAINISELDTKADAMSKKGLAKVESGTYVIDLDKLGYGRLIGAGKVTKKLKIKVNHASSKAVERVKAAGGEVELLQPTEEVVEEVTQEE